jgi:hypothetical protein
MNQTMFSSRGIVAARVAATLRDPADQAYQLLRVIQ